MEGTLWNRRDLLLARSVKLHAAARITPGDAALALLIGPLRRRLGGHLQFALRLPFCGGLVGLLHLFISLCTFCQRSSGSLNFLRQQIEAIQRVCRVVRGATKELTDRLEVGLHLLLLEVLQIGGAVIQCLYDVHQIVRRQVILPLEWSHLAAQRQVDLMEDHLVLDGALEALTAAVLAKVVAGDVLKQRHGHILVRLRVQKVLVVVKLCVPQHAGWRSDVHLAHEAGECARPLPIYRLLVVLIELILHLVVC